MKFADRAEAGRRLAARLRHLRDGSPVVVGLPRGGVPVAFEVATALDAPLDVILVRKLGVPSEPELAMGAIGEGGIRVLNDYVMKIARVTLEELARVEEAERFELVRRSVRYRETRPRVALSGRITIVVDDGIATGSTAIAACRVARAQGASRVVLAAPVAPPGWEVRMGDAADELVCLETPEGFFAIGQYYVDFSEVSDDDVLRCLGLAPAASTPVSARNPDQPLPRNPGR